MSVLEWLLWAAICWAVFFAYAAVDAPPLCSRAFRFFVAVIRPGGRHAR